MDNDGSRLTSAALQVPETCGVREVCGDSHGPMIFCSSSRAFAAAVTLADQLSDSPGSSYLMQPACQVPVCQVPVCHIPPTCLALFRAQLELELEPEVELHGQ